MGFLKAGLTFAVSTGTRMVAGLLIVKIISLYVGAEGLGQLGQFMSVIGMITVIAGGGISIGLVKYISQHRSNDEAVSKYLSSGSFITLISSAVIAVLLILFANSISQVLIGTVTYADVIYVLAIIQFILGVNNYAVTIINANLDARGFALVSVGGTVVGASLLCYLTFRFGLHGAMYGLVFMPAMVALFSIPYVFRHNLIDLRKIMPRYNRDNVIKLLRYSGMMAVQISTLPLVQIVIRNILENREGWKSVGYWQGVSKISDAYLQFVTVVLANYYLPRLSAKTSKVELKLEVYTALRIALPTTLAMAFTIYLLRVNIIKILFTSDFLPMQDFFLFQMIGDCLKVCAWTIVYVGISKAMTKICVLADVFQAVTLVALSWVFINRFGTVGATYAYALNYLCYFIVALMFLGRYLKTTSAELRIGNQ